MTMKRGQQQIILVDHHSLINLWLLLATVYISNLACTWVLSVAALFIVACGKLYQEASVKAIWTLYQGFDSLFGSVVIGQALN